MPEDPLDEAHAILRRALRDTPPSQRPPPPYHAGGPLLVCPALDQIRVSLWCAELLDGRGAVDASTSRTIDELVTRWLEDPRNVSPELRNRLVALGVAEKNDSAPLFCRRRAASGAVTYLRGKPDLVFSSATAAVARVVKELVADPSPVSVTEFLRTLDHRLTRSEMAAAYRERVKGPGLPIDEVLFRAGDAKGKVCAFVARLEGGEYAFLGRLGEGRSAKWSFTRGSRDDALASVPDALFAAAAARVPG